MLNRIRFAEPQGYLESAIEFHKNLASDMLKNGCYIY